MKFRTEDFKKQECQRCKYNYTESYKEAKEWDAYLSQFCKKCQKLKSREMNSRIVGKRVLIFMHNVEIRNTYQKIMYKLGYSCEATQDFIEGLAISNRYAFDLVLMDLSDMPQMDFGIAKGCKAWAVCKKPSVIGIINALNPTVKNTYLKNGFDAVYELQPSDILGLQTILDKSLSHKDRIKVGIADQWAV